MTKATNCVCDFILSASEWARELDAVPAEERKKRPLFGIPMSIKECFKVKGSISVESREYAVYFVVVQETHRHQRNC